MGLTHGLLYLLRMGIDNHGSTFRQGKDGPSTFEDMGVWQEIHDTILLTYGHTLVISLEGCMELSVRQDDTLRIACRTTGIEDVGNIIIRSFLLQGLHLRLTRQVLTQLQEVAEIDCIGVMCGDMYHGIVDNDTFQSRTERESTTRLVILVLFAYKEETHLGVVDHELDLLL